MGKKDFQSKVKVVRRIVGRIHLIGTSVTDAPTESECKHLLMLYPFLLMDLLPATSKCDAFRTYTGVLGAYRCIDVEDALTEVKQFSTLFKSSLTDDYESIASLLTRFKAEQPLLKCVLPVIRAIYTDALAKEDRERASAVSSILTILEAWLRPSWGLAFPNEVNEFIEFDENLDNISTADWIIDSLIIARKVFVPEPRIMLPLGRFSTGAKHETVRGTPSSLQIPFLKSMDTFVRKMSVDTCRPDATSRITDIRFVNKSALSNRTIGTEPVTLAFAQHAVMDELISSIKRSELSRHIDFEKPFLNGQMAVISSLTKRYATIDLSSASDSVSLERHIIPLFRGSAWLPLLCSTRSNYYELNGRHRAKKFSQMGSSVTFPLMTIFLSLVIHVAAGIRGIHTDFRVYGDDIVVEQELYDDVIGLLEALGFKVNTSKSFSGPQGYRESCGDEAWKGYIVTPYRFPRTFLESLHNVDRASHVSHGLRCEGVVACVDVCNELYVRGMHLTRRYILGLFDHRHIARTTTLPAQGLSLLTDAISCTNFGLRFAWSSDLWGKSKDHYDPQLRLMRCLDVVPEKSGPTASDDDAYTAWFFEAAHRQIDASACFELPAVPARRRTRVRLGYVWRSDSSERVVY